MTYAAPLESRALFEVHGPEATDFLQNILTNNVETVKEDQATYTALLTPQGKYQFDFFLIQHPEEEDGYLIDCPASRLDDLIKRLTFYRLRANVHFEKREDLKVAAIFGSGVLHEMALEDRPGHAWVGEQGIVMADPRLASLGARLIYSKDAALETFNQVDEDAYHDHLLIKGVPDVPIDAALEKDFLLELNAAELNGVDFSKGCFIGQELVSRMRNRHTVKKRLLPFTYEDDTPELGAALKQDGKNAGEIRRVSDTGGMAYVRLDRIADQEATEITLETENGVPVIISIPEWLPRPFPFYAPKGE